MTDKYTYNIFDGNDDLEEEFLTPHLYVVQYPVITDAAGQWPDFSRYELQAMYIPEDWDLEFIEDEWFDESNDPEIPWYVELMDWEQR